MKEAIIVVGGYNSAWPAYLGLARHLEDLSGLQAVGVPLMPWDWWQAERTEDGTGLLRKLSDTVSWARRKFRAKRFILVGHSAGGLLARLYLCSDPVWDREYGGVNHVSVIVTLGSPHQASKGTSTGWFLADKANELLPGTPFPDRIRCSVVAGRHVRGSATGSYRERRAFQSYRFFAGQGETWGDGTVPVESAGLPGTETQVLDGIAHSRKIGSNWYGGTKAIVRRWWPAEEGHDH